MDPLSQGTVGAAFAQSAANKNNIFDLMSCTKFFVDNYLPFHFFSQATFPLQIKFFDA